MARAARSITLLILLSTAAAPGCVTTGKFDALKERVTALEGLCAQLGEHLEAAQAKLDKTADESAKEVESIRGRMADIGGDLSDLERTVARVQGRQEEIDFKLAEVSNRLRGIKGVVEDKFGVDVEDLPQNLPESPEEFFTTCQDSYKKNLYKKARALFREFVKRFPTHEKADDAQFMVGECYFAESRFDDAVIAYKQVYDNYQQGDRYREAVLRIGLAYQRANSCKKALQIYEFAAKTFRKTPEGEQAAAEFKALKKTCKK